MLIDWFTVIAQVINFLILAWLLKRFLYRPILNAIDAREKRIATELADADAKRAEAEQQREEFEHKNAAFDAQQTTRMNQLTAEVKTERDRLFNDVRQASDDLRDKLQFALKNGQQSLQESLSKYTREEVFHIARQALKDLADSSIESAITAVFIQRFHALTPQERAEFKSIFNNNLLIVRTAFTLPKEQCSLIEDAIKEVLGYDSVINADNKNTIGTADNIANTRALEFVVDSAVVSGIEISANGQKIAWSINDYLASLASGVDQLLQGSVKGTAQL